MTIVHEGAYVSPSNETVSDQAGLILLMCSPKPFISRCTLYPIFTPTEYLWETHGGESLRDRWEIYGNAVRDMMCEQTGLLKND